MGWTSFSMHQPIKEWFKEQWNYDGSHYEVVDSALVNRSTLYGAIRDKKDGSVFCAVVLVRWCRGYYNFSYKDMTEHSGPGCVDCPKKIFKLLTPLNDKNDENGENGWAREWRENVQKFYESREKLKTSIMKTVLPLRFTSGNEYQYFKKYKRDFYAGYLDDNNQFVSQARVKINPSYHQYEFVS
jgi:hypothetical protein